MSTAMQPPDNFDGFMHVLGEDGLVFLAASVVIGPLSSAVKQSPVLGYLIAGFVLNQVGVFVDNVEVDKLSEVGVQFLLFEMGLELSSERLRALSKYTFGLGTLQLVLCGAAFTAFLLPVGNAVGTRLLEDIPTVAETSQQLINIRGIDEAVVIGMSLALSSSAFVLQILSEKKLLSTRLGSATLGILLLQDIAVVPLLVALPLIEQKSTAPVSELLSAGAVHLLGLGSAILAGKFFLARIFKVVKESQYSETFVALSLLTVTGMAAVTKALGVSDTLGAFVAGGLLAETSYREQIEENIKPVRGLLLGLFFMTTGTLVDTDLLVAK